MLTMFIACARYYGYWCDHYRKGVPFKKGGGTPEENAPMDD